MFLALRAESGVQRVLAKRSRLVRGIREKVRGSAAANSTLEATTPAASRAAPIDFRSGPKVGHKISSALIGSASHPDHRRIKNLHVWEHTPINHFKHSQLLMQK